MNLALALLIALVVADVSKNCLPSLLEDRDHIYVTVVDPRRGLCFSPTHPLSKGVPLISSTSNVRKIRWMSSPKASSMLDVAGTILPASRLRIVSLLSRPESLGQFTTTHGLPPVWETGFLMFWPTRFNEGEVTDRYFKRHGFEIRDDE